MKEGKRKKKRKETGKRESYKYYEIGRIVLAGKEGKRGEPEKRKREKKIQRVEVKSVQIKR